MIYSAVQITTSKFKMVWDQWDKLIHQLWIIMESIVTVTRNMLHTFKFMVSTFTHICFNTNHQKQEIIYVDVKNGWPLTVWIWVWSRVKMMSNPPKYIFLISSQQRIIWTKDENYAGNRPIVSHRSTSNITRVLSLIHSFRILNMTISAILWENIFFCW